MCSKCGKCNSVKTSDVNISGEKISVGSGGGADTGRKLQDAFGGIFEKLKTPDTCAAETIPDLIARMMGKKPTPDWTQDDRVNQDALKAADKLQEDVASFLDAYKDTAKLFLNLETEHEELKQDFERVCDELATAKAELAELDELANQGKIRFYGSQISLMEHLLINAGYKVTRDENARTFSIQFAG